MSPQYTLLFSGLTYLLILLPKYIFIYYTLQNNIDGCLHYLKIMFNN